MTDDTRNEAVRLAKAATEDVAGTVSGRSYSVCRPNIAAVAVVDGLLAAGWQLAPPGAVVYPAAECDCTPPPSYEGPCSWCDVHGTPSAAWQFGSAAGRREAHEIHELDIRRKVQLDPKSDEDVEQLAEAIYHADVDENPHPDNGANHARSVLRRLSGQEVEQDLRTLRSERIFADDQLANENARGIRLTHEETGTVVESTSERSLLQNQATALRELRHRLAGQEDDGG